jgi:hypothetical protein
MHNKDKVTDAFDTETFETKTPKSDKFSDWRQNKTKKTIGVENDEAFRI